MKKSIAVLVAVLLLTMGLTACVVNKEQPISGASDDETFQQEDKTGGEVLTDNEEQQNYAKIEAEENTYGSAPYLSLTYNVPTYSLDSSVERVIYSYDINTKQLKEECVLTAGVYKNDTAVFSRENNTVYYSALADPKKYAKGDSIWAYNIETGEVLKLEDENRVNYGFTVLDPETLLVYGHVLINHGAVVPALLDLESKTYINMSNSDDNLEYITSLLSPNYYNYKTQRFVCIYCNYEEFVSDDYRAGKTELTYYVALASKDLTVDEDKIFAYTAKINELCVSEAIQISENELLLSMRRGNDSGLQLEYYSLVFGDEGAVLTKVDCPYPYADYVNNLCTIDGGNTYFFYLLKEDKLGNTPGVYSYCPETDELTPILLNDPEKGNGIIRFTIVGSDCETDESQENCQSGANAEE